MVKKISTLALAGLLALPAMASAGAGGAAATSDMQAQMDALTKQLNNLKAQMAEIKTSQEAKFEDFDAKSEKWDLASRFQWSGDIRNRADFHTADTAAYFKATDVGKGIFEFGNTFNLFAGTFGGLPALQMGALAGATLGDLAQAQVLGAPVGTATGNALLGMNTIATTPGLGALLAVMPSLTRNDPTKTFGAVGQDFANLFAAGNLTPTSTVEMINPQNVAAFMRTLSPADRKAAFIALGYPVTGEKTYNNDTLYTTRMRLNLRAKATEDVEVKARIVGYKAWGMQDSPTPEHDQISGLSDTDSPYFLNSRSFDGTVGRQPGNSALVLDRAFMNWNNIGGSPVWFSAGRRPTTDGPPAHLRMGQEERMATPVAYMDYPFDGVSLGYAYNNLGTLTDAPGRIRFCYGRGFENGPQEKHTGLSDVDFAGLSWDVYSKGSRFFNIQSFGAFNIFNVPGDTDFPNPLELAYRDFNGADTLHNNGYLDRMNMGNIFQTAAVYMDKYKDLNYFGTLGWSHTVAKAQDEMGTSLLGDFWAEPENKDGYSVAVGVRYDIADRGLKLGAEYNHGSKNWLAFAPGHDDMYSGKMAVRGNVYEVYGIYDLPAGEAISKYGKAFIRLGVQHYDYNYTYSGMWLGTPNKIEDIQNDPMAAQFYAPIKSMDQVYLTFEANF